MGKQTEIGDLIMDYEKKYKEALERVRRLHDRMLVLSSTDALVAGAELEFIFPELKENEDERIRNGLIAHIQGHLNTQDDFTRRQETGPFSSEEVKFFMDALAWLEKQKEKSEIPTMDGDTDTYFDDLRMTTKPLTSREWFEEGMKYAQRLQKDQKPADCIEDSVKYEEGFKAGRESGLRDGQKYVLNNLDSYGLCKPAEWSEDYREEDIQTRFAFYTYKDDSSVLYLSNVFVEEASRNHGFGTKILIAAEKVAETIGATTISLKVKQDSPANIWYRKRGYGYVAFEDGYDWLEKNLEYMKTNHNTLPIEQQMEAAMIAIRGEMPSKSQEWDEEDELMMKAVIGILDERDHPKLCRWLKSLRPSWKPSEEQMEALEAATVRYQSTGLESLYEDLKKRM